MKPRSQLRFANLMMTVGVTPWLLALAWAGAFLMLTPVGGPPAIPILDPLSMIGFMGTMFLFALCVAGLGAAWSWLLTRDDEELGARRAPLFRSLVLLALIGPLLALWLANTLRL
jgi:hypothetical protein